MCKFIALHFTLSRIFVNLGAYKVANLVYRVAQNKIPHQAICNIFATSGQILKILEAV